ncbi:ABC transporter substrate-binding protein [Shinella daejeonensis]|uniref:ABC transporter substrate-binding protein n=1 Tax=Shinella daejeonensis TaxID=659017 RepID=UPI0020C77305|nr:ABC transporter substrate-binding protein [Shinella daejeonensis]MCP8896518.1 ABC transporter substrate-binding protein [Shinella daejeonensis]
MGQYQPTRRDVLRRATSLSVLAAASAVMPSLGQAQELPAEITSFEIISVRDPQHSAQLALALESGFFKEEGLDVTANYTVNGPDLPSLAASGQVKVLCSAMEHVASLRLRGLDFKWIMKLSDISNTQGVVIGEGAGINKPQDLSGKRVGMFRGASVELAIENMCKAHGIDFKSLQFINMEPPEQAIALMRNDIDVMACWEPYVSNAAKVGGRLYFTGAKSYIDSSDAPTDVNWLYLATGLSASSDMRAQAPNTLFRVMRAMMRASKLIIEDPAAAAPVVAKGLGIPPEGLDTILRANDYRPDFDERLAAGYPDYIRWAVERKFMDSSVPLDDILERSFLTKIAPQAVRI